jgi:outer membrane lipoprotein-sorting protein
MGRNRAIRVSHYIASMDPFTQGAGMTLRFPAAALAAFLSFGLYAAAPLAPAEAQTATLALPAHDLVLVDKATKYLQSLDEVQGRFEQTNPRGVVQAGDIYLKRPGKVRFQYDPPSGLTVVSDGRAVSVWDSRLRTFDRTPLGATPLAILLAARVRLDQDVEVVRVGRYEDGFYLTVRSATGQAQTEGYITLVFGENPMTLRGWTLVDGQGQATKLKITSLAPQPIKPELFVLNDPRSPEERGIRAKRVKPSGPSAATSSNPAGNQGITASTQ